MAATCQTAAVTSGAEILDLLFESENGVLTTENQLQESDMTISSGYMLVRLCQCMLALCRSRLLDLLFLFYSTTVDSILILETHWAYLFYTVQLILFAVIGISLLLS